MADPQERVIRIRLTDGRSVAFPAGTPVEEMESALKQIPPLVTTPSRPGLKDYALAASEGLPLAGATVGGLVGAEAGPVGAVSGAGLGYMGGKSLRNTVHSALGSRDVPQSVRDIAMEQLRAFPEGAAGEMTGQVSGAVVRALPGAGLSLATRIVKPNKVALRSIVNDSFGSTLADKERNVVKGLLDQHALTMGESGPNKLQSQIRGRQGRIESRVAQTPDQPVPVQGVLDAGNAVAGSEANQIAGRSDVDTARSVVQQFMEDQGLAPRQLGSVQVRGGTTAPQRASGRTVDPITGQVRERLVPATIPTRTEPVFGASARSPLMGSAPPPTMPLQRADAVRSGTWGKLRNKVFGKEVTDAEANTVHAMNSALTAAEREAAPDLGPMLDAQGRDIGMSHVLDEARWRWGRNNPIPLDVAAATHGGVAALAAAAKPSTGLPIAKGLYYGGNAANQVPQDIWKAAFRAAMLELLTAGETPAGSAGPTIR